jgi:hypothetical protein
MNSGIERGSIVVYIASPLLFGKLIVIDIAPDGRLLCEAVHSDRDGEFARGVFAPMELETFDRWNAAQVAA